MEHEYFILESIAVGLTNSVLGLMALDEILIVVGILVELFVLVFEVDLLLQLFLELLFPAGFGVVEERDVGVEGALDDPVEVGGQLVDGRAQVEAVALDLLDECVHGLVHLAEVVDDGEDVGLAGVELLCGGVFN